MIAQHPFDHAQEMALSRFRGHLAREYMQARLERRPMCPLRPLQTLEYAGEGYGIERLEAGGFDTMSGSGRYTVTITAHESGKAVESVWRKQRRNKRTGHATVRYTTPAGPFAEWDDVVQALVASAAGQLAELDVLAAYACGSQSWAGVVA